MWQLISLLVKKFTYGFEYQKVAIFEFGEKRSYDTVTALKLCDLNDGKVNHLNQVQIHNFREEQRIGFANYELDIREKQNLESVLREMALTNLLI